MGYKKDYKKENEVEDRSRFVDEAAEYLTPFFKPAVNSAIATNKLTTNEVYDAIHRLNPTCQCTLSDVYNMLDENGFIYEPDPSLFTFEYKWLLVRIA